MKTLSKLTLSVTVLLSLIACGNSEQTQENHEQTQQQSLIGNWTQTNNQSGDNFQTAVITEDYIEIYWNMTDSTNLYWAGSYDNSNVSFVSTNDLEVTEFALFASGDETKNFEVADNTIKYEVSAMGMTTTVILEFESELTPLQLNDLETNEFDSQVEDDILTEEVTDYSPLDDIKFYVMNVRNDVTGNWKYSMIAETLDIRDYVIDYYNNFFTSDDEIHFVINVLYNTTTKINKYGNLLFVATSEYVDKEEHDSNTIFGGTFLEEFYINMDTLEIVKTQ